MNEELVVQKKYERSLFSSCPKQEQNANIFAIDGLTQESENFFESNDELVSSCDDFILPSCRRDIKEEQYEMEPVDDLSHIIMKKESEDTLMTDYDSSFASCSGSTLQIKEEQYEAEAPSMVVQDVSCKDVKRELEYSQVTDYDSSFSSGPGNMEHERKKLKIKLKRDTLIGTAEFQKCSKPDVIIDEDKLSSIVTNRNCAKKNLFGSVVGPSKNHKCLECDSAFVQRSDLSHHVLSVHLKWKPFQCSECGKAFSKNSHLTRHSLSVHKKIKVQECPFCSRAFSVKWDLTKHIRAIHEKIKPYKCSHCESSFTNRNNLSCHIIGVHERKKIHICSDCNGSFSYKGDLYKHIIVVHKQLPHECLNCDMRFRRKCDLTNHMTIAHRRIKQYE